MEHIKALDTFKEISDYNLLLSNEIMVDHKIIDYKKTLFHLHDIITVNLYDDNYYLIYDLQNNSSKLYKMN